MSLPDRFETYEDYREWLDEAAEVEIEEFLDINEAAIEEHGFVDHANLRSWIVASPQFDHPNWNLARLYDDVERHTDAGKPDMEILLPVENPWNKLAKWVASVLVDDVACRAQELLEERGYDVE